MINEEASQKLFSAVLGWSGSPHYCALERLPDNNERYLTQKAANIGLTISQSAGVMDGWDYGEKAYKMGRWHGENATIVGLGPEGRINHDEWLEGVKLGIAAHAAVESKPPTEGV